MRRRLTSVPAGPLTLEQVLALAEARSETIAISRAGVQRAEGEQTRARSGLFPQLSASASYDRALASEFEGLFDNVRLPERRPTGADSRTCRSAARTPGGSALAFSQNLYTGGRLRAQDDVAAARPRGRQLSASPRRAAQLLFDVTQAYYDAALSDRLVGIAEATLEQAGATLRQTQAGFDAGTQPEFEVLRARVTRDNQTPLVIRQRVNREVALLRLKQLLDLPQDFDLQLADALGDERLAAAAVVRGACGAARDGAAGRRTRRSASVAAPCRRGGSGSDRGQRSRGDRPAARGSSAVDRGAAEAERDAELDLHPARLSVERVARRSTAPTGRSARR